MITTTTTPRARAFSLIELSVVVAIIGILAALAVPTFLTMRVSAQDRTAHSAIHNIEVAAKAVAASADDGKFPSSLAPIAAAEPAIPVVEGPVGEPNKVSAFVVDENMVVLASYSESGTCFVAVSSLTAPTTYASHEAVAGCDASTIDPAEVLSLTLASPTVLGAVSGDGDEGGAEAPSGGSWTGAMAHTAYHSLVASAGAAAHYPLNCHPSACSDADLASLLWVDHAVLYHNSVVGGPVLFATDFAPMVSIQNGNNGDQGALIAGSAGAQLVGPLTTGEWVEVDGDWVWQESVVGGPSTVPGWSSSPSRSLELAFRISDLPPAPDLDDPWGTGFTPVFSVGHGFGVGLDYRGGSDFEVSVGNFKHPDAWGPPLEARFSLPPLGAGTDHHLVVIVTESAVELFFDGVSQGVVLLTDLDPSATVTGTQSASPVSIWVRSGEVFFDELALYTRALSPAEVANHYATLID